MTRSDPDDIRKWRRDTTFWLRFALVASFIAFAGQVAGVVVRLTESAPPTLHTRRITVGNETVTLEIPDGQCASALGVSICVPFSSSPKVSP